MTKNIIALTTATVLTLACGSDPDPVQPGGAGASATAGTTGQAQAGSSSTGGAPAAGAAGSAVGGAAVGGSSSGGAGATGGASATGGNAGAGASGAAGSGGSTSGGGSGGASGGAGGGTSDIAKALDGMRVDDGCAGTADTSVGAVCGHAMLTASNGFKGTKQATLAGTAGSSYDVTLRIRGIVEPTAITGGMRPDTSTFQYRSMDWRKVPYTIGGAVSTTSTDPDYTQWHIAVASPKADYYLNDYQKTGHYIFKLDYQITIQVDANSAVTLDGTDRNERQIVNYEKYTIDGIPGSVNYGQFIQINVVSVKPH